MIGDSFEECEERKLSVDEIKKYKETHTSDEMFESFKEFCTDCKTLTERMFDLYKENSALLIMSNVRVEVKITAFDNDSILDVVLGCGEHEGDDDEE